MNHGRTLLDTDRNVKGQAVAADPDRGRQAREQYDTSIVLCVMEAREVVEVVNKNWPPS